MATVPLFAVLLYFLYAAYQRPSMQIYQLTEEPLISLADILAVFLTFHVLTTMLAVYLGIFIPKRRHLIGRYLAEGETVLGDVIYDKSSRVCGGFNDYGYAVYPHPTQKRMIRKRVRVFQQYTREKIAILRLPNRPLSGQAKIDLEIDINVASNDRDTRNTYIIIYAICWVLFTLLGSIYVLLQMYKITDEDEDANKVTKVLAVVTGLNIPVAFAFNWTRFLLYRNWMMNRGAVVDNNSDVRKVQGCLMQAQSDDGSDVIPYSIFNEEEKSYQGSFPSYASQMNQPGAVVMRQP